MAKQGKDLVITEEVMREFCRLGYDYEYGARNLERVLRRYLLDKLAAMALGESWPSIRTIRAEWQTATFASGTANTVNYSEIAALSLEDQDFIQK